MALDDEINQLYQLPLAEFTAARNALAARAGARGAEIRRLPKPNAAAWAVNQIFWKRAKTRDRLVSASRQLQRAHAQQLAGQSADTASAEALHRAAINAAGAGAREILEQAGESASAATLDAVRETLQTVVWQDLDGRLSRPLKPSGLEALMALKAGARSGGRAADVVAFRRPAPGPPPAESRDARAKREAAERQREAARVSRDLEAARKAERTAQAALARAQKLTDAADRERSRLTDAIEAVTARLQDLRADVDAARKAAQQATDARGRLDARLEELQDRS